MLNINGEFGSFIELAGAVAQAEARVYRCMSAAFFNVGDSYTQFHKKARLSGRPGLNTQSRIGLSRSTHTEVAGADLDSLNSATFFSGPVTKYVKVHEFGATIVPVRAKLLRFQINGKWFSAKKVTIPPRLKWFEGWDRYEPHRNRILENCMADVAKGLAK